MPAQGRQGPPPPGNGRVLPMAELREYKMTREDQRRMRARMGAAAGLSVAGREKDCVTEVWMELGRRYGFDWRTARPAPGKGERFFLAEPIKEEVDPTEEMEAAELTGFDVTTGEWDTNEGENT